MGLTLYPAAPGNERIYIHMYVNTGLDGDETIKIRVIAESAQNAEIRVDFSDI